MEDFCINGTSQDESYNNSNITFGSENHEYNKKVHFIKHVMTCIIIAIGLPLTWPYILYILWYLVITCPLWYRCRRTIKSSVVVCVLVWTLLLVFVLNFHFWDHFLVGFIVFGVFLLLPLPLFIFFLGGTLKVLSASISVPFDEKQRIVGLLVLVLLIYMLLFLPKIISFLKRGVMNDFTLHKLSGMFLRLNPLADSALYVFMKNGTIDKLLASVCCCRMDSNDISSPSV